MSLFPSPFPQSSQRMWPVVVVLIVAVLAPTLCVLWFMNAAMENERLAVRQRLQDVYGRELTLCQNRVEQHWKKVGESLEASRDQAPAEAFAKLVSRGLVETAPGGPDIPMPTSGHLGRAATRGFSIDDGALRKVSTFSMPLAAAPPGHALSVSGPPVELVGRGLVESALVYRDGRLAYPRLETHIDNHPLSPAEEQARALEQAGQFVEAAEVHTAIALDGDINQRARAMLGEARARLNAERLAESVGSPTPRQSRGLVAGSEVIALLTGALQETEYEAATDFAGRLVAPSAMLLAIESLPADDPTRPDLVQRLAERLRRYEGPEMSSSQRLFLMQQLHQLAGESFSTMTAEKLAIELASRIPPPSGGPDTSTTYPGRAATSGLSNNDGALSKVSTSSIPLAAAPPGHAQSVSGPPASVLHRSDALPDLWILSDSTGQTIGIWTNAGLIASLEESLQRDAPGGASFAIHETTQHSAEPAPFLTAPEGGSMPDWTVALSLNGPDPFAAAAQRHEAAYLWMACLAIGTIGALAVGLGLYLRQQMLLTRLKNDLIATVSHELKTPLSSMRVLTDTLLDGRIPSAQDQRDYLQLISRENLRLSRLIDNFLTFSRMERQKAAFEFRPLRVQVLVDAALEAFGDRAAAVKITVPPQLTVLGDADALVTLLVNLLDNAWKYSGEKKEIELTAEAVPESVEIRIHDNGIGIARRHQRRIFQRFFQVDRQLSRQTGGCGLGLAIVQFIARAHRATVDVISQPGHGSTFIVRLPTAIEPSSSGGPDTSLTYPGRAATRGVISNGESTGEANTFLMPLAAAPPGHAVGVSVPPVPPVG